MMIKINNKPWEKLLFGVICWFSISFISAQTITLEQAIELGLSNNLSLKLAEKDQTITSINTGKGAAGMLPSVSANAGTNFSINNANQTFLDGRENSIIGGSNFQLNGEVRMDWTLFDGRAMYIRKDQLDLQNELSKISLNNQILDLAQSISEQYQNLVQITKQLEIVQENITYLQDLLQLSESKLSIGSASKLDVLQAKTDLNEILNERDLIQMQYDLVSTRFNQLLNQDLDIKIQADSQFIEQNQLIAYENWLESAIQSNPSIAQSKKMNEIALQDIELAKSSKMPQLDFNAGLNYGYLQSTTGFLVSNVAYGPFIGLSATYNIYDGKRVERDIQTAELMAQKSQLDVEIVEQQVDQVLYTQYQTYQYYQEQLIREKENIAFANENFDLADQLYKNGSINQFELRQVFIQKRNIEQRVVQSEYQLAIAYIQMMRMSGQNWF